MEYDDKGELKLIDFGVAIEIEDNELNDDYVGTLHFLPPESVCARTGEELKAGDMWSIGVIAYVLVCGMVPFAGHDHESTLTKIITQDVKWPPGIELTGECQDFIESLLDKDPELRLTADEALGHPWLENEIPASEKSLPNINFDRAGYVTV